MNDLFSGSSSRFHGDEQSPSSHNVEMTGGLNFDKFSEDVEAIKDELRELETLYKHLRSRMDNDVASSLKSAKLIEVRLEALDAANRNLPGSSSDRIRTSIVNGLLEKLHDDVKEMERNLKELHQVLVERQGEQLQVAKKHQKNKRSCFGVILLLVGLPGSGPVLGSFLLEKLGV